MMLTALALMGGLIFSRLDWSQYVSDDMTAVLVVYRAAESVAILALAYAACCLGAILLPRKYQRTSTADVWLGWRSERWTYLKEQGAGAP